MKNYKLVAFSPLLLVVLLSAIIILVLMIVKGGTIDEVKKGQEIKTEAQINLQQVNTTTSDYNKTLQDALSE